MNKKTLIQKIEEHLNSCPNKTDDDWGIANAIYDGCMNTPSPANGGRIAAIRRVCYKSDSVIQIDGSQWSLKRS